MPTSVVKYFLGKRGDSLMRVTKTDCHSSHHPPTSGSSRRALVANHTGLQLAAFARLRH